MILRFYDYLELRPIMSVQERYKTKAGFPCHSSIWQGKSYYISILLSLAILGLSHEPGL